jgi:hypothetical protein
MSRIRTVQRENFVSLGDLRALQAQLEPGDILLQRRNWYLTNVGIPGFWPHVALYTGSMEEMTRYFQHEVGHLGASLPEYIATRYPELSNRLMKQTEEGYTCRIIEALAPGIVPTPLEISGRADYLAVLRPRLSRKEKLHAILKAFSFYDRPYDYAFDFATDNELVCSELVFKSYRPGEGQQGLHFELQDMAGRLLLPPNHIARKFDAEYGNGNAELAFVAFLDGREKEGKAVWKTVDDFRPTWRRPKWDIAQE